MRSHPVWLAVCLFAAPALAPAAETYTVDAVHSSIVFRVKHLNTSYAYGRFNDIAGSFTLDPQNPSACRFRFTVKSASIDTANEKRDQHLKGPDFFNVRQFPNISFQSTRVTKVGDAYEVTGDLSLHGVTKPVTARIEPTGTGKNPRGGSIAGIEATFDIQRSAFGMTYGVPDAVGDDVRITVSVEGSR